MEKRPSSCRHFSPPPPPPQAPKKKFEEMDASLTTILSEMGTALSLSQFNLQSRSYNAITDLQEQVD